MKVHAIGVLRVEGISKKSGALKDYDMSKILVLQPCESANAQDEKIGTRFSKTGFGYEPAEIDLDSFELLNKFSQLKFPVFLELEMGQAFKFGKLQTVCVNFKQVVQ